MLASTAAFADMTTDIEILCQDRWGSEYKMVAPCIQDQQEALEKLEELDKTYGIVWSDDKPSVEKTLQLECVSRWYNPEVEAYDIVMILYCTKEKLAAYSRSQAQLLK